MSGRSWFGSLINRLKRATVVYAEFGPREMLVRVLRRFGLPDRQLSAWREQKSRTDAEFDRRFGTDTGGVQTLLDEQGIVGDNAQYGLAHIATDPSQFSELIDSLNLPNSEYTFVDLGCGKGRALLLAAQYPFKSIVGVEFVPSFVQAARRNLEATIERSGNHITVVLADATQFVFPPGPLIVYLFNPFDSHVIRQVARNARASWQKDRRPFIVVYSNPVHQSDFVDYGWQISRRGSGWVALECGT